MKLLPEPRLPAAWRTLQAVLLLSIGAVAASARGQTGTLAWLTALVWVVAVAAAVRYAWFSIRHRRTSAGVLAVAVVVFAVTGGRLGGAIAGGILLSGFLVRGMRTHRRIGSRPRAVAFFAGWVPLVLMLALKPELSDGPEGNLVRMARVSLLVFLIATQIDLLAHMRLHFLRLRPKLAVSGILIGVVPLVILTAIGLLVLYGALGGSRANRGADIMETWRGEWAAGGRLDGLPAVDRFAWSEADGGAPPQAWLGSLLVALRHSRPDSVAAVDTTSYLETDNHLWLVRCRDAGKGSARVDGLRLDGASLEKLARMLRADVALVGMSEDTTKNNLTFSFGDKKTSPSQRYLSGDYRPRDPQAGSWRRPMYFGGSLVPLLLLDGPRLEDEQILLSVKTSLADLRDEFVGGRNEFNLAIMIALGVIAVMLLAIEASAVAYGVRIAGGIVSAVRELHRGTRRLAAGELDTHIEVPNEDEFGDLAQSFNDMADAVKQGREDALACQRLEQEMETARAIQSRLLPAGEPMLAGFEITGKSIPSRQVGGDYFDFLAQGDGRLGVAIGDVSGKGMPAALLMANLQASLQGQVIHPASVAEVMQRINNLMVQSTDSHMFASFYYGVLETTTGRFTASNAGHNPPLLLRADGRAEWLTQGGLLLGMMPDLTYPQIIVDFAPGDVLVMYTDGITEAEAPGTNDDMFGEEGLEKVVRESAHLSAFGIREAILAAVQAYLAGDPAGDDITLVVIKRKLGERIESQESHAR